MLTAPVALRPPLFSTILSLSLSLSQSLQLWCSPSRPFHLPSSFSRPLLSSYVSRQRRCLIQTGTDLLAPGSSSACRLKRLPFPPSLLLFQSAAHVALDCRPTRVATVPSRSLYQRHCGLLSVADTPAAAAPAQSVAPRRQVVVAALHRGHLSLTHSHTHTDSLPVPPPPPPPGRR